MKGPESGDKESEIRCNLFQELGSSGRKNNILLEVTKKVGPTFLDTASQANRPERAPPGQEISKCPWYKQGNTGLNSHQNHEEQKQAL